MQVSSCWTEELPLRLTLKVLRTLARDHFEHGGRAGAICANLLKEKRYSDLVNFQLDQSDASLNWGELLETRQGLAFFQKLEDLDIGVDKTQVAIETFMRSEASCRDTNNFLRTFFDRRGAQCHSACLPSVVRLLEGARRKIRRILKNAPSLESLHYAFGPGATTDIRKTSAAPVDKMSSGFQCSSSMLAAGVLPSILRQVPHWADEFTTESSLEVEEVDGSDYGLEPGCYFVVTVTDEVPVKIAPGKLVCVPKSAKTYRTIIVEPNLNGFVQQGIRRVMERRLKQAGLDTGDQSRNQRMAQVGSLDGSLATLDLSSASDLISYELVKLLLPEDWFRLLTAARTGAVEVPGEGVVHLEKFSSMGNACTFPLETLIFWAIATSATPARGLDTFPEAEVAVYGDDIIIPVWGYSHVKWALEVLGFTLNPNKSFAKGAFRESCGHDYYKGINIRPFYQKKLVSGQTLFVLHNFYYRSGDFERAKKVISFIPKSLRIFGPDGYGDGHLLSDCWGRTKRSLLSKGFDGLLFDTFTLKAVKKVTRYPGDFVSPLYSIYSRSGGGEPNMWPDPDALSPVTFTKDGRPRWGYPGFTGYKRISIYTYP